MSITANRLVLYPTFTHKDNDFAEDQCCWL